MHRLLRRILKKSDLSTDRLPDSPKGWRTFLEKLDEVFVSHDEDRYLLERSLEISSKEMEELLEASKESYQQRISALVKVIPDLIFYIDEDGRYLDILSQGNEEFLYFPKDEIIGKRIDEIFPDEYATLFGEATNEAIERNCLKVIDYSMFLHGERLFFEARIMPTNIREKGKRTAIAIVRDMTAQKRSIDYLRVIKKIFEDATEGILIVAKDGSYYEVNDAFCKMLGLEVERCEKVNLETFLGYLEVSTQERVENLIEKRERFGGEVTIRKVDGKSFSAWLTIDTVNDEEGEAVYHVAMLTDISELKKSQEKLRFTATHDPLTKLPNRTLLIDKLEDAIQRSLRNKTNGALFFIDLDNFKEINDTAGHGTGDKVLVECSRRIRTILRKSDLLGRLGGDEFLLITENLEHPEAPMHVASKIIEAINRPFLLEDESFELGSSIGIALFPEDSINKDALIQYADMAMYQAKEQGKNRFQYYSTSLDRRIKHHYMIEKTLKEAVNKGNLYLLYQPQVRLEDGKVTGVEALVRVDETIMGLMSPSEFIPIAEESRLISKIGRWVFEECVRQLRLWKDEGLTIQVAVNLSRRQLMDETWVSFVAEILEKYEIDSEFIEWEITETTFMQSKKSGSQTIRKLQEMGFRFSIDDFGTGYSSLANLKQFTVDKLKIDRSFIVDIEENESDRAIVEASVALAHALGLTAIAEGVENEGQKAILMEMGCDEIQGYLFSRPITPEKIPALMGG